MAGECREYCRAPSCMQRNVYSGIKGIDIVKIVEWTELWRKNEKINYKQIQKILKNSQIIINDNAWHALLRYANAEGSKGVSKAQKSS